MVLEVVTSLVEAGALEGLAEDPSCCLDIPAGQETMDNLEGLRWLAQLGFVFSPTCEGAPISSWRLTQRGAEAIEIMNSMHSPSLICALPGPGLPIVDMSRCQRALLLESKGWQWRELPRCEREREAIAFSMDAERRVWC